MAGRAANPYGAILAGAAALAARPAFGQGAAAPGAPADMDVLIVGAGFSGVGMGIKLKEAGIPFTIVEKNAGVGGTWWENHYPGARVDVAPYKRDPADFVLWKPSAPDVSGS